MTKTTDDDIVISLVELALARPAEEREAYLKSACAGDPELYQQVLKYVEWESRMNGFLLEPFYTLDAIEHPFAPGDLLDQRFRIMREVAQGGMGVVFEAMDEKLGRRVALKCAKAGFGKRLSPEILNATAISHPNVCKIFEIHTASTRLGEIDFLTMEFLEGETLAERLDRGPLPKPEAAAIARQLCAGLAEAHRNKVIHGDLKSNNVILTKGADGAIRAVITDFGLARAPEAALRAAQSGTRGGTPDYMAPELWKGEKASISSDIYALGVVLYELACGRRPSTSEAQKPASAHPKWNRVLSRCLDPDPLRRFASAAEVAEALAPRSRRWWLTAAAAVGLATVSGAITYERVTAPPEAVSMALLPLTAAPDAVSIARGISRDAETKLARLKSGKRAQFTFVPPAEVTRRHVDSAAKARTSLGATHVVRAVIAREQDSVVLHAFVTNTKTQANVAEREFKYAPGEVRYAGTAMAGMVTAAFHLPALAAASVNAAAKQDYVEGLGYTRRNSTIDRALPLLERAVSADPDSPLAWAALAEAQWFKYFITQDSAWLHRTSESLRQAQDRNLDLAPVHRVAGVLRANAGFYEQAEAEYLRAIELEPKDGDAYRRLGQAYDRGNQTVQALAALQKAIELAPNNFRQYQALGAYYTNRGDSSEAIRQFEKCVQLAPDEPDALYALGTAYYNAGQYIEAERELRKAIALGEIPRALNNLAITLMYQGRDQEAIPFLIHALGRFPGRSLWWMNLGDAYRRAHVPEESQLAYRRSLELVEKDMAQNPRDGDVRARLAYLCARLGDRQRAESEVAQALQLSPESTDTRGIAVWTYEALGKRDDALAILRDSSDHVLASVVRRPDLAELRKDSRFQQLVEARQVK